MQFVATLPEDVAKEMDRLESEYDMPRREVLRKAIKLLLVAESIEKDPKADIMIVEEGKQPQTLKVFTES